MVNIAIQGICGRMGHALQTLIAQRNDCHIVAGIDRAHCALSGFPLYQHIAQMQESPDVLIDFSLPEATRIALTYCAEKKLPIVVCTTGLDKDIKDLMHQAAKTIPVFFSANMSLGINLLASLAQRAQALLPGFDIEIIEKHHHNKLDAPSGTALLLADAVNEQAGGRYHYEYDRHTQNKRRDENEIGISSVRAGSIVGEHEVLFAGPDEVVTLSHTAYSRDVFATGAIAAALFLSSKEPGMYAMKDLIGTI